MCPTTKILLFDCVCFIEYFKQRKNFFDPLEYAEENLQLITLFTIITDRHFDEDRRRDCTNFTHIHPKFLIKFAKSSLKDLNMLEDYLEKEGKPKTCVYLNHFEKEFTVADLQEMIEAKVESDLKLFNFFLKPNEGLSKERLDMYINIRKWLLLILKSVIIEDQQSFGDEQEERRLERLVTKTNIEISNLEVNLRDLFL